MKASGVSSPVHFSRGYTRAHTHACARWRPRRPSTAPAPRCRRLPEPPPRGRLFETRRRRRRRRGYWQHRRSARRSRRSRPPRCRRHPRHPMSYLAAGRGEQLGERNRRARPEILFVTTHAAGSGCLHCHGRGPVPLSCAPPPATCPFCETTGCSRDVRDTSGQATHAASPSYIHRHTESTEAVPLPPPLHPHPTRAPAVASSVCSPHTARHVSARARGSGRAMVTGRHPSCTHGELLTNGGSTVLRTLSHSTARGG